MDTISELMSRLPKILGGATDNTKTPLDLDRFASAKHIVLRWHYDLWRQRIRSAGGSNQVLSNGWAFATMSGLACFESFVRADPTVKQIYFNKSGEIDRTVDDIRLALGRRKLAGAIVYGYGNLLRESHFVEAAMRGKVLNATRIYLLDCSLFYYLFAKSPLNPLRTTVPREKSIRAVLMDYCEKEKCNERLVDIRNDLNPFSAVLHLFLGNTFCNLEASVIGSILDSTVKPGDIVVAEYANYDTDYFRELKPDYVNIMAMRSAAELFSITEDRVKADVVAVSADAKALKITVPDEDMGVDVCFRSMLRRRFLQTELTAGKYALLSTHQVLKDSLRLDAYQKC